MGDSRGVHTSFVGESLGLPPKAKFAKRPRVERFVVNVVKLLRVYGG